MTEQPGAPPRRPREVAKRLEAASWGVFFLWVGCALLLDLSIGVGLVGVGAIALITQLVRKLLGLPTEGFWVLIGLGFVIGGVWNLYAVGVPLAPVLLFGLGALLLGAALLKNNWGDGDGRPRGSSEDRME